MIQRIQTLYLLGIVAVISVMIIGNSNISSGNGLSNGLKSSYSVNIRTQTLQTTQTLASYNYGIIISLALSLLLSGIIIFLYRNLALQKRLCMVNFVLILLACIFIWYTHFSMASVSGMVWENHFSYGAFLAFLPLLLNYFALRGIRKDIDTLASADRLR